jgi:hypothetical protein
MKKRVIWLVIIVLLISAVPMALVFSITGNAVIPVGVGCPCTAPDGIIVNGCYAGNNINYTSYYCEMLILKKMFVH